MTREQAWAILDAVCARAVGTLADHQQIQAALAVMKEPDDVAAPEGEG